MSSLTKQHIKVMPILAVIGLGISFAALAALSATVISHAVSTYINQPDYRTYVSKVGSISFVYPNSYTTNNNVFSRPSSLQYGINNSSEFEQVLYSLAVNPSSQASSSDNYFTKSEDRFRKIYSNDTLSKFEARSIESKNTTFNNHPALIMTSVVNPIDSAQKQLVESDPALVPYKYYYTNVYVWTPTYTYEIDFSSSSKGPQTQIVDTVLKSIRLGND